MEIKDNVYNKYNRFGDNNFTWQKDCLEKIKGKRNIVLSSPTGSGKTKVFLEWARSQAEKPIIITAPIKALSNQRYRELLDAGYIVGLETGDIKNVPDNCDFICCTQEIYTNKYLDLENVTLIIDEFHYIFENPDRTRAYIDALHNSKARNILLCSATFGNIDKLTYYIDRVTQRNFVAYKGNSRLTDIFFDGDIYSESINNSLVVTFSKRNIENILEILNFQRQAKDEETIRAIYELAAKDNIDNSEIINNVKKGISGYYGSLLPKEKLFIEKCFENGIIDTVVGTDALALGVNFPVKNVIFAQLAKYYDGPISKNLFDQLAGRAGRKGFFDEGHVYYCSKFAEFCEARGFDTEELYGKILDKQNEDISIVLSPNIKNILLGKTTIEEEVQYILEFSTEEMAYDEKYQELSTIVDNIKCFFERKIIEYEMGNVKTNGLFIARVIASLSDEKRKGELLKDISEQYRDEILNNIRRIESHRTEIEDEDVDLGKILEELDGTNYIDNIIPILKDDNLKVRFFEKFKSEEAYEWLSYEIVLSIDDDNIKIKLLQYLTSEYDRYEIILSMQDDKKVELVKMLETDYLKSDIIASLENDEKKLELLETLEDEECRSEVIISLEDDEKKLELLETLEDEECKSDVIASLEDDEKKLELLETLEDEECKSDVIASLEDDEKKLELLETLEDEGGRGEVIASLEDDEKKLELLETLEDEGGRSAVIASLEDDEKKLELLETLEDEECRSEVIASLEDGEEKLNLLHELNRKETIEKVADNISNSIIKIKAKEIVKPEFAYLVYLDNKEQALFAFAEIKDEETLYKVCKNFLEDEEKEKLLELVEGDCYKSAIISSFKCENRKLELLDKLEYTFYKEKIILSLHNCDDKKVELIKPYLLSEIKNKYYLQIEEYDKNIANAYFPEYNFEKNCKIFTDILLGNDPQRILQEYGMSNSFYDMLQFRKYVQSLPKKYRKGLTSISDKIREIDETAIDGFRESISVKEVCNNLERDGKLKSEIVMQVLNEQEIIQKNNYNDQTKQLKIEKEYELEEH